MALIQPSDQASPEIWHQILQEAVQVPIFLDPDPVMSHGPQALAWYCDEGPYWESERTRNALRRVFSSWNAYLEPMAHRYVDVRDIGHGYVPPEALRTTYRVDFRRCYCEACQKSTSAYTKLNSFLQSEVFSNWRIQILRVQPLVPFGDLFQIMKILLDAELVSLRCITADKFQWYPPVKPKRVQGLLFYTGYMEQSAAEYTQLTTLTIALRDQWPCLPQRIPTLRHLAIFCGRYPHQQKIFELLHSIGRQLLTFCWRGSLPPSEPMHNAIIWDLLPSVKFLQLPNDTDLGPPAPRHPIGHIRIHLPLRLHPFQVPKCKWCDSKHRWTTKVPSFLEHLDGAHVLSFSFISDWSLVEDRVRASYARCLMSHFLSIAPRIKFVDDLLVTMEEHDPSKYRSRFGKGIPFFFAGM